MNAAEHLYLFLYVAAMAFALLDGGFRRKSLHVLCLTSLAAAFLLHAISFGRAWAAGGVVPSVNMPQLMDLTVLFLTLTFFLSLVLVRHREILFFLTPMIVLFLLVSGFMPHKVPDAKPYFSTLWFPVHIFLLVSGMALILFSFIYSAIFIMQDHSLRKNKAPSPMRLPSISVSEKWSLAYLRAGFLLFTAGFLSSALYGLSRAGTDGSYRPGLLEAAALLSWIVLGTASFGWMKRGMRPRRRAFLVVAGSALFLFIFMGMQWH